MCLLWRGKLLTLSNVKFEASVYDDIQEIVYVSCIYVPNRAPRQAIKIISADSETHRDTIIKLTENVDPLSLKI
jgi:hypothetical protein